jgi:DNA-directed RNA polymerase II subunit RPB2
MQQSKMDTPIWDKIIHTFFDEHSLTEHQLDSYNRFIQLKLTTIIQKSEIVYNKKENNQYKITFDNIYLTKPEITEPNGIVKPIKPYECRIRGLSYTGNLMATIKVSPLSQIQEDESIYQDVFIGSVPIMLKSNWCHLYSLSRNELIQQNEDPNDVGGYFIINGSEKALISQDRMAHNENFIFKVKDAPKTKQNVANKKQKNNKKKTFVFDWIAEIRSYCENIEPNISTTLVKLTKKQLDKCEDARLYVEIPTLREVIPWPVLFKALNVTDPQEMIQYVCSPDDTEMVRLLKPSLEFHGIDTQDDAISYISKFVSTKNTNTDKIKHTKLILKRKFLQNVSNMYLKRFYLGYITHQLLATVLNRRNQDDRDHYAKKRVDTCGGLMNNLFKSIWKKLIKDIKTIFEKKRGISIPNAFHGKISVPLKKAFGTGQWSGTKVVKSTKIGVSQLLNSLNEISKLSNLRRIKTPTEKNNKIVKPRHAHSSHFGFICPAETPEGQETGLLRNLSIMTTITQGCPDSIVIDWLKILDQQMLSNMTIQQLTSSSSFTKILVNGQWVAISTDPLSLISKLRSLRKDKKIPPDVSFSLTEEGIRIYTDEGRLWAPFIVVQNGSIPPLPDNYNWSSLVDSGIIEYLDPAESETMFISTTPWSIQPDHTHSLIHPSLIFGIAASTVPFPNHDQSPRVIYQSAMGKQALGFIALNYLKRYDTSAFQQESPQEPILRTTVMQQQEFDLNGNNLIVAVLTYTGFNQEDSVIVNKTSIDNGILRTMYYSTYSESNKKKGNATSEICKPRELSVRESRIIGYEKLDDDGMPFEETPLMKKDIVIGHVTSSQNISKDTSKVITVNGMEENSVERILFHGHDVYKVHPGHSTVQHSILTTNEDRFKTSIIRTRQYRVPVIGDKLASRHAQKGIIGMILPAEDMPFSESTGMSPDLIMNPNAFPSRMTTGQSIECILSKLCCLEGRTGDCTPFQENIDIDDIGTRLQLFGFNRHGNETLINGKTGERMQCDIFMGPTYYQRLKHMVADKIHSRTQNGPREILTRQPVDGRKRSGGFKVGEMETWCGISHGASNFLIDRLVNNSDSYEMYVCDLCGNTSIASLKTQKFECKRCQQNTHISKVKIPYAFKLLQHELMAAGIGVWITVDKDSPADDS